MKTTIPNAAFCPAIQCGRCLELMSLADVSAHPSTDGTWRCKHCGHKYPNSDVLKAMAPHVKCVDERDKVPA